VVRALASWAVLAAMFIWIGYAIALPRFWVYAAIWLGVALYGLLSVDPSLITERRKPAGATLDWSDTVPPAIRMPAMILYAAALLLAVQAMITNRYFSIAVRIQTDLGHRLVSSGPYRIVRHPGYLGMLFACPASVLALGSWLALVPALLYAVLIVRRAAIEDRYLQAELDGYAQFASRVRYRLIPGVW
jgi:protein-S-isoprenylcysteine O-methyltransferase Ste14